MPGRKCSKLLQPPFVLISEAFSNEFDRRFDCNETLERF